ncbi:MAG: ribonuclease T [Cellvibrionales bacterium]|nr:ribonuclease T [Cellvibrionales bacterium]
MAALLATEPAAAVGPRGIAGRFRGFLPVVVDVETGGFDAGRHALLEVAAVPVLMNECGRLAAEPVISVAIEPFAGAVIEEAALEFTGIDLADPERGAVAEKPALTGVFQPIRRLVREHECSRAVLVAHNAHFDLGFINAACARQNIKRNPFHPFSCFDTATLAGLAYGQTVLARACACAQIAFDSERAHSAAYDAEKTAALFCRIVNAWDVGVGRIKD